MSYHTRSPPKARSKYRSKDSFDAAPPRIRSGNVPSRRDQDRDYRDSPRAFSDNFDNTQPRDSRDRSSSPPRGRHQATGHRVGAENERYPPNPDRRNSYRPTFNSSPRHSPVGSPLNTHVHNERYAISSPLASSPRPNTLNNKSMPIPEIDDTPKTTTATATDTMNNEPREAAVRAAQPDKAVSTVQKTGQPQADLSADFSDLLFQLFEDGTDLAALKAKKNAAERELNRRDADYNKSKAVHSKFPATEESQRRSKDVARKALQDIREQCQQKNAYVKHVISNWAPRNLPALRAVQGGQDEDLKLQITTLSNRCQDLENQLRNNRAFIENQRSIRQSQDEKDKEHDLKISACNMALVDMKVQVTKATEDIKTLGEKSNNFARNSAVNKKGLEDMRAEFTESSKTLARISEKSSSNLKTTVPNLSQAVSDLQVKFATLSKRVSDQAAPGGPKNNKEAPITPATIQALADHTKTLDSYGQKLSSLEASVKGNGSRKGLDSHISFLVEEQASLRQELATTQTNMVSLDQKFKDSTPRLDAVDIRLGALDKPLSVLSSNVELELVELRTRVAHAESSLDLANLSIREIEARRRPASVEQLSDLEQRISSMENRSNMPSALEKQSPPATESITIAKLEKRVANIETRAATGPLPLSGLPGPIDMEAIQRECGAVVESMISSSIDLICADLDALKANEKALTSKVEKIQQDLETSRTTIHVSLSSIPSKFDALTKSVQDSQQGQTAYVNQLDVRFQNWATDHLRLHEDLEKRVMPHQDLDNRVQAVELGCSQLDQRMGLLNTKEMAIYILNQMDSTYPNLRDAQNTLAGHKEALKKAEDNHAMSAEQIKLLTGQILILEDLVKQKSNEHSETLRIKVEDLDRQIKAATEVANTTKQAVDKVSKASAEAREFFVEKFSGMTVEVEDLKKQRDLGAKQSDDCGNSAKAGGVDLVFHGLKDQYADLAVEQELLRADIAELKGQQKDLAAKHLIPNGGQTPPSDRAPITSGPVLKIRGNAKLGSGSVIAEAHRNPSGEPLLKRRFPAGTPPAGSSQNGFHSSTRKQKRMRGSHTAPVHEDDAYDSEHEPQQPGISDEEE